MKKLLGIVVLGLLWSNISYSQILEINKCTMGGKYSEERWEVNSKHLIDVKTMKMMAKIYKRDKLKEYAEKFTQWQEIKEREDRLFTINTDSGIVTETIVYADEYIDFQEQYSSAFGKPEAHPKVWTRQFNIKSFAAGYLEASVIIRDGTEYTIQIDIDKSLVHYSLGEPGGRKTLIDTFGCVPKKNVGVDNIASSGSGFFINNKGYFVTNNHVVEGCSQSQITFKGESIDAELIATDQSLDLALLKVKVKPKDFLNLSNDPPVKLQKIYVAGYPFGKGLSDDLKFTQGIISSVKGFADNSNQIQIDAAINSGNSGGPIVNEDGSLVAVAVSGLDKSESEGIGFGIKANSVINFLEVNNVKYSTPGLLNFGMNSNKLNNLLEKSTVYTFCN